MYDYVMHNNFVIWPPARFVK